METREVQPGGLLLLPDRFPLGPAAGLRRGAVRDVRARPGQETEPWLGEIEQLLAGVEVNAEPVLRPFVVPDRESPAPVLFDHGVTEVDLGRRRVRSHEEQATGSQSRRALGEVRVGVGRAAMLNTQIVAEVVERRIYT